MRVTNVRLLAVAVPVLALAACASPSASAVPAQVAPTADCLAPQIVAALGLRADTQGQVGTPHPDVPAAGAVPDGFVPVGAVVCQSGERLTDVKGIWDAVTVRRLEGDMDALVAALGVLAASSGGSDPACTTSVSASSELWLVDAMGRGIRAAQPVDACGAPLPAVARALGALTEIEVAHYPVHLVAARASAAPTGASAAGMVTPTTAAAPGR